jgi:hypothetical protein
MGSPTLLTMLRHRRLTSLAAALGCLVLVSFPVAAEVYPVNGVWVAPDPAFPVATGEACFIIKTIGVEAVSRKSIFEVVIFTTNKRYDLKGGVQTEGSIESVRATDGGFWITELSNRKWFVFRRKYTYFLAIVDASTIEIRDNSRLTRFVKCGPRNSRPRI